jgi:N-acetylglucosaminyldiphosphoundecaprenol N-acetyl-beta-D-mannosaminyltransferase
MLATVPPTGRLGSATLGSPIWPAKHEVIGVPVSTTDYAEAVELLTAAARQHRPTIATALAVHGTVEASHDPALLAQIASFDLVLPDGQPVRWALNLLFHRKLRDRVYGPELMLHLCNRAAAEGIGVYLYGSTTSTASRLRQSLQCSLPTLRIVGCEASLFRPLTAEEDRALVGRIAASGAGFVFIGLGCPLQERFAFAHRHSIHAAQICVGAAFDFHAGNKRQAPRWMQDRGLEWLFRLGQEPRRLARRYLVTNSAFLWRLSCQFLGRR